MTVSTEDTLRPRSALEQLEPYQPGKPRKEIAREYNLSTDPVKLASNENPYPPPESLRSIYEDEFESLNRYPDGGTYYLRETLSEQYDWPMDGIVVGAGSDEITDFLVRAYLEEGDEIVVAQPSFIRQSMLPRIMGATVIPVPVTEDFDFDLERMLEAVTDRTRWICLPNPNNPTSQYVTESRLRSFLKELNGDILVLLDEAYYEFMDQDDYPNGRSLLSDFQGASDPTVVLQRTFSKAYGLAGLRIGYSLMDASIARQIHKVRPPFNVTRPAQAVAEAALSENEYISRTRREIKSERSRICRELQNRGINYVPPEANFMLISVPESYTSEEFFEAFLERGVIIRSMAPYGLDTYVRLSVGKPSENDQFLRALDDILE